MSAAPELVDPRVAGRRLLVASVAAIALAVVGGLVWAWLAEPAEWEVRDAGIVLTQAASRGQFSVIVVFVLIGIVTSLVIGGGAGWALSDLGWLIAPVVVALTVVAAVITWQLGIALGPPSPTAVSGVSIGDRIPARLEVDALAPFLVWPIFGLAGVVVSTWAKGRRRHSR